MRYSLPMRGSAQLPSIEVLARELREEFPELDATRLHAALERAHAKARAQTLDTEGYQVVNMHLQQVEQAAESSERARILRELSETLEGRGDLERAFVTRLAAFDEAATVADLDPLLRIARVTKRWSELPLPTMNALIDISDDAAARRLTEIAEAWQELGKGYYAADCLERVLLVAPSNAHASEMLELFYRTNAEWPVLVDLLARRAVHVETDRERAELYREIAQIHERELADDAGALDAYQESNRLEPNQPAVLDAIARTAQRIGNLDEDALTALVQMAPLVADPNSRAEVLLRAAKLALLVNYDQAQSLFARALADAPDLIAAIDGLASLLRDRGQLADAVTALLNAAERPSLTSERSRWLTDAADFCVALGDTDWAKQLYRDAREADPQNAKAGVALVELCRDTGSLVELVPILDDLCRTTDDPVRLRGYLIARSKAAAEVGDQTGARSLLSRAVDLDPQDFATKRELGDMLFEAQQWDKARGVMEALFEHEDLLGRDASIELHYRVARSARELGDNEAAKRHAAIALAIAPDHRPSLLLREQLDKDDPAALTADQLALANLAPPEERATRFAALGDRYIELGDRATAREMYREALQHRAGDHLLLTKYLEVIADEGDWSYSLEIVRRLIDSEKDAKVRARYAHLAGMIARDELDAHDKARELLARAIDDDPDSLAAADDYEALLEASDAHDTLVAFYHRRLEHVRSSEPRPGERLRLWDKLGELLLERGHHDDALVAFEVALTLDPGNAARRIRLVDLYDADPANDAKAIEQHHLLLRSDKRRGESYKALRTLYARAGEHDRARACAEALFALDSLDVRLVEDGIAKLFERTPEVRARATPPPPPIPGGARPRSLATDDWLALSRIDVDLQVSTLFALVAPAFAAERARIRPPPGMPAREHDVPSAIASVLAQVAGSFGIALPPVYLDRTESQPCRVALRARDNVLVPVLVIGKPALDALDRHALAFALARQLADLRVDRIPRLLVPRAGELAQIIESAIKSDSSSGTAKWLTSSLHPAELDQALALGTRLRERDVQPLRAAVEWLAATERAADRIGFVVVGDLANCIRVLERDPSARSGEVDRLLELIWSSVTEEVLAVRARVEGWEPSAAPRQQRA
jgi:tetratricopeptide (TPR) repeat protein